MSASKRFARDSCSSSLARKRPMIPFASLASAWSAPSCCFADSCSTTSNSSSDAELSNSAFTLHCTSARSPATTSTAASSLSARSSDSSSFRHKRSATPLDSQASTCSSCKATGGSRCWRASTSVSSRAIASTSPCSRRNARNEVSPCSMQSSPSTTPLARSVQLRSKIFVTSGRRASQGPPVRRAGRSRSSDRGISTSARVDSSASCRAACMTAGSSKRRHLSAASSSSANRPTSVSSWRVRSCSNSARWHAADKSAISATIVSIFTSALDSTCCSTACMAIGSSLVCQSLASQSWREMTSLCTSSRVA